MTTTLPAPGSPEFMVVWTALQQFVDNADDIEAFEEPAPETVLAQKMVEQMDAALVAAVEAR